MGATAFLTVFGLAVAFLTDFGLAIGAFVFAASFVVALTYLTTTLFGLTAAFG